jgi:ankyrin repeat protein
LIETKGCDVNVKTNDKNTPVQFAFCFFDPNKGGDTTVLMYLLAQTNINGYSGETLLHSACQYINTLPFDIFKLLIETHGADVNAQVNNRDTPLHNALSYFDPNKGGTVNMLTYLLSQKSINANIKGWNGYTVLHIACEKIHHLPLEIFKLLIETHGADVNAQNNEKDTPLHRAIRCFRQNGGNTAVLTYLLSQANIDVNIKGQYDWTLLYTACYDINRLPIDVFKVLIETHGCDVNVRDDGKDIPLRVALRYFDPNDGGDITVLMYLLTQKGVNGDTKGQYGDNLLHWACRRINYLPIEIFKLLIETLGYDVNAQNKYNDTPLHNAFLSFDPNDDDDLTSVLVYLVDQKNIDVNITNSNGHTFLHLACICGISDLNNVSDSEDDGNVLEAKSDTLLSQIVQVIVERCVQQIVDESSS